MHGCLHSYHTSYEDTSKVSEPLWRYLEKRYAGTSANMCSSARPIYHVTEKLVGIDPQEMPGSSGLLGLSGYTRGFLKIAIRVFTIAVIIIISILVPSFDTIMALMGSAMAFSICIVLPLAFHLKIFGKEMGMKEKMLNWFLIVICSFMAIIGTVWVFLPKQIRESMDGLE